MWHDGCGLDSCKYNAHLYDSPFYSPTQHEFTSIKFHISNVCGITTLALNSKRKKNACAIPKSLVNKWQHNINESNIFLTHNIHILPLCNSLLAMKESFEAYNWSSTQFTTKTNRSKAAESNIWGKYYRSHARIK